MYLKFLYNTYENFFSSKKVFLILIISWFSVIIFTYLILPPATDDMFYFWPALNFFYENRIGMYEGNRYATTYFQFPIYSLLNSFFLNAYTYFDYNISIYSYKLFNKILLILLFLLSIYWFRKTSNTDNFFLKINTFLFLITFTPFSLGTIGSVRPEVLGIVFVLIALIFFKASIKSNYKSYFKIILSAVFLGLGFITHPQFFTVTSVAALVMLLELFFNSRNYKLIFIYCFFFVVPVILLFYWYYLGYPVSLDFLLNRANYIGSNPFHIIKSNISNLIVQSFFLSEAPIFIKLYQLIFTLPYFFFLISIFPLILIYKRKNNFSFDQKITISIFVAILFNFSFIKTYDFYHSVIAFFVLLALSSLIQKRDIHASNKFNNYFNIIFCVIIFLLNSIFISIHSTKFLFSNKSYFYAPETKKKVFPHIHEDTILVLTSEKLFGVFIELFQKQYSEKDFKNIYMLFPFPDAGPTKNQLKNAKNFLKTNLVKLKDSKIIFGSKKNRGVFDESRENITLILNGNLKVKVNINKVIFEDKEHIFFTSKKLN